MKNETALFFMSSSRKIGLPAKKMCEVLRRVFTLYTVYTLFLVTFKCKSVRIFAAYVEVYTVLYTFFYTKPPKAL